MTGEDAPDFPCVLQFGLPDLHILKGDSLAVKHSKDVMVWLHEESCRIGERLIFRKPRRMGMPVRADDGQGSHMLIKRPGDPSCAGLGRKQTIWMDQHNSGPTLSLRIVRILSFLGRDTSAICGAARAALKTPPTNCSCIANHAAILRLTKVECCFPITEAMALADLAGPTGLMKTYSNRLWFRNSCARIMRQGGGC